MSISASVGVNAGVSVDVGVGMGIGIGAQIAPFSPNLKNAQLCCSSADFQCAAAAGVN